MVRLEKMDKTMSDGEMRDGRMDGRTDGQKERETHREREEVKERVWRGEGGREGVRRL